jgi:hypothetical protein
MPHEKFDVAHLARLNDPDRFETMPPEIMWEALGNERELCPHLAWSTEYLGNGAN